MACTRRHTTTPFIKIFRESESVGQIPDPSTFFSPATGWKRERGEKETREENGVQDVVAQYTYMFRLGGLNFVASGWITTRSNRIADRLIGTVAVSWFPEAKRSISRSGETSGGRAPRGARYTEGKIKYEMEFALISKIELAGSTFDSTRGSD